MRRLWTEPELAYLREHYATTITPDIAAALGRSKHVVSQKALSLGLSKDKAFLAKHISVSVKRRSPWTPEHLEIMELMYPHCPTRVLVELFGYKSEIINEMGVRMGLKKTKETLAAMQHERMSNNPEAYKAAQIKVGSVPWNKGTKGISNGGGATRFQKGVIPSTTLPIGSERWKAASNTRRRPPYLYRKVAEPNVWRAVHQILWEEAHGPIPSGYVVRFKDGNHKNFNVNNLECISKQEHSAKITPWALMPRELAEICVLRGVLKRQIKKAQEKL